MKLWIDDVRQKPADFDFHAKTSQEAITIVKSYYITFISFDHDLGGDDTGYLVANYIESLAAYNKIHPIKYAIHSANPIGRKRIEQAMNSAERFWKQNALS